MRLVGHCIQREHDVGDFLDPPMRKWSFQEASTQDIIDGPVAALVDCIPFGMVGRSKKTLDVEFP